MIARHFLTALAALALFIGLSGCGSGGKSLDVEGTVLLNGKDLEEGDITFVPEDKNLKAEGGKIANGKFRLKAPIGKCKVEIRATRVVPGKTQPSAAGPDAPPEPLRESIVPAKYNDQTTLNADVGPGKTTFKYELKTP